MTLNRSLTFNFFDMTWLDSDGKCDILCWMSTFAGACLEVGHWQNVLNVESSLEFVLICVAAMHQHCLK